MNNNLKSCPFCGSDNIELQYTDYTGDIYNPYWSIYCNNCPAHMVEFEQPDPEIIINLWNTRAN